MKGASDRLKQYIEELNDHIVKIVESESEEFLEVGSKLECFRKVLTELKEGLKTFHQRFTFEKGRTEQALGYLESQYSELSAMVAEKERLESLVRLQEMYQVLLDKVKSIEEPWEIEECSRMVITLRENAKVASDPAFNQQLLTVERQLIEQAVGRLDKFISSSGYFNERSGEEVSEEDHY